MEYELALSFSKKETLYLQTFLRLIAELPQIPGVISGLEVAAPYDDGSNSSMPLMFPVPKNSILSSKQNHNFNILVIIFTTKGGVTFANGNF